ncbi:TPA: ankyrin repeat domain-containing protein [Legionella pneumophila]|nr:ankyrin repeat domain-containing protein [Legionella pneumophila]
MKRTNVPLIEMVNLGSKTEIAELIRLEVDLDEEDAQGDTAVLAAARRNDSTILETLVKAGASLNVEDALGFSPLFWAQKNQNTEMEDFITQNLQRRSDFSKL